MSILLTPFEETKPSDKPEEDEQLLVFGYGCKLFRDDSKAILESSGQLLIPWMGDNSLMVDRYDVRNKLEDKSQFGVKSILPYRMSAKERELEEELDKERYLALYCDDLRVEEQEEEERRRASENNLYSAIGFSYGEHSEETPPPVDSNPPPVERVEPDKTVEIEEEDKFVVPEGLVLPNGIKLPATKKLHSIIQKTAMFVSQQGTQMEIIIKTKQQSNPLFSFLTMHNPLFPYYCHLKTVLRNGSYVPVLEVPEPNTEEKESSGSTDNTAEEGVHMDGSKEDSGDQVTVNAQPTISEDNDSSTHSDQEESNNSDSDDESGYLHPLLMQTMQPRSKSVSPKPTVPTSKEATSPKEDDIPSLSAVSFRAKSMVVNAAPVLLSETTGHVEASVNNDNPHGSYELNPGPPLHFNEPHPHYQDGGVYPLPPHIHEAHYPHPHMPHYPHPPPTDGYPYSYNPYYAAMGAYPPNTTPAPPLPPPELRAIIDKTAAYVAKNGDGFEATVLKRHVDDPRFGFLNPWGEFYAYYRQQKLYLSQSQPQAAQEQAVNNQIQMTSNLTSERPMVQKLSSSGAVSFKLQTKSLKLLSENGHFEDTDVETGKEDVEPQAKKPKVDTSNGEQIGSTVQEFLSTVKEMFRT